MASREYKIGKQAADGMKRHITFTVPDTLKIIMRLGSATCCSVIMAVHTYKNGLLAIYGIKTHKEKITHMKSGHYMYCLINGILNNQATLLANGCQIK